MEKQQHSRKTHYLWTTSTAALTKSDFYLNVQKYQAHVDTYRAQSTAIMSVMSSVGSPTDVNTITMVTRPACGIPAAPMLAAVAVILENMEN